MAIKHKNGTNTKISTVRFKDTKLLSLGKVMYKNSLGLLENIWSNWKLIVNAPIYLGGKSENFGTGGSFVSYTVPSNIIPKKLRVDKYLRQHVALSQKNGVCNVTVYILLENGSYINLGINGMAAWQTGDNNATGYTDLSAYSNIKRIDCSVGVNGFTYSANVYLQEYLSK